MIGQRHNRFSPLGISAKLALAGWLGLCSLGSPGWAATLFAGITDVALEASPNGGVQLSFQSDLPFQCAVTPLDANRVRIRLENARLADGIKGPRLKDNRHLLNIAPNQLVQQAYLLESNADGTVETLQLEGPGLGNQTFSVTGLAQLKAPASAPPTKSTPAQAPLKTAAPIQPPEAPYSLLAPEVLAGQPSPKATTPKGVSRGNTSPSPATTAPEAVAMAATAEVVPPEPSSPLPKVVNPPRPTVQASPQRGFTPKLTLSAPPPFYQPYALPSAVIDGNKYGYGQEAAAVARPEKALPRYLGGAPPITFTVTTTGETHSLPQTAPAPQAYRPPAQDGGYNALSYAEPLPQEHARQVEKLLNEAVSLMHQRSPERAVPLLQRAQDLAPQHAAVHAALGEVYLRLRQYPHAAAAYANAVAYAPAGTYEDRYALALYRNNERDKALPLFKQLMAQQPHNPQYPFMAGTLLQEVGQVREAIPLLQTAARLNPQSADVLYNLGLAYELEGRPHEAAHQYAQAARIKPSDTEIAQALQRVRRL
jgi:tetratricopeptide (TPR) repeat protein